MVQLSHTNGEKIIHEDNISESLYLAKKGIFSVQIAGKLIRKIYPKDSFGECSIVFEIRSTSSVVAFSELTECYQISKALLMEALGEDYKSFLLKGIIKDSFISHGHLLNNFYIDKYFEAICLTFEPKILKTDEIIIHKRNIDTDKIFIVAIGEISKVSNLLIIINRAQQKQKYLKGGRSTEILRILPL